MKLASIYLLLIISHLHTQLYAQQGKCMSGDCRDGFGHFLWESGDYYIGDWQAGRMSGYGVLYWKTGKKYMGSWAANEMNGEGTMYYANGMTKTGIWRNNEFVQLKRKPFQLTPNHLQQARNQLFSMLHDRPMMLAWLSPKHADVWQWIERKMAGEDTHSLILWQAAADEYFIIPQGVKAVHRFPTATHEGAIWVDSTLHAEEMWSGFIFELFNIRNYIEFQQITYDVMHGRCNEEEYIMRYARLEHKALLQTIEFYNTIWIKHCKSNNLPTQNRRWYPHVPATFEAWIAQYTDPKGYPWYPYRDYYQTLVRFTTERY